MNEFNYILVGHILLGVLIGWGITSCYYDYKQGKTIFNRKASHSFSNVGKN